MNDLKNASKIILFNSINDEERSEPLIIINSDDDIHVEDEKSRHHFISSEAKALYHKAFEDVDEQAISMSYNPEWMPILMKKMDISLEDGEISGIKVTIEGVILKKTPVESSSLKLEMDDELLSAIRTHGFRELRVSYDGENGMSDYFVIGINRDGKSSALAIEGHPRFDDMLDDLEFDWIKGCGGTGTVIIKLDKDGSIQSIQDVSYKNEKEEVEPFAKEMDNDFIEMMMELLDAQSQTPRMN